MTNLSTGDFFNMTFTTPFNPPTTSGAYASGAMVPGDYQLTYSLSPVFTTGVTNTVRCNSTSSCRSRQRSAC
ncbi:MAG: hypothetical protein QM751_07590 [Paludibacteraceae bacterium]